MKKWLSIFSLSFLLAPASFSQDLSGLLICIDPGHGGAGSNDRPIDLDKNGSIDFYESESNFKKAVALEALLEARGAVVILTRNTNSYPNDADEPSLSARVAVANSNNVDWFHSIHSNATGLASNTSTNNTLVLVREKRSDSDPAAGSGNGFGVPEQAGSWTMAQIVGPKIRAFIRTNAVQGPYLDWTFYGGINGGFSLGVLRGLLMPGELSEGSFHDFYPEAWRLLNRDYCEMEAYALLQSFQQYFGAAYDGVGIIAGVVTDNESQKPRNNVGVRLLSDGRFYTGDAYNNGFFMFDSVAPGTHWIRFENTGYRSDSVQVTVTAAQPTFVDRAIYGVVPPYVVDMSPKNNDTTVSVSSIFGVTFSRAMDTASVRAALSITPNIAGTYYWLGTNSTLLFDPIGSLLSGTVYTWKIDTTALSAGGLPLDALNIGVPNAFIVQVRTAGTSTSVGDEPQRPTEFGLRQNFPNPFNPSTTITVDLPHRTNGTLVVYDAMGREVARLLEGEIGPGVRTVVFDASRLPSGIYLCELRTPQTRSTVKLLLLK